MLRGDSALRHLVSMSGLLLILGMSVAASASDADAEIQALLSAVGNSGCSFSRNGSEYSATKAESHLRLKYSRGKRYAPTAEDFIERLASRSSWTGIAYTITCPGAATRPSGQWLAARLEEIRNTAEADVAVTSSVSSEPSH